MQADGWGLHFSGFEGGQVGDQPLHDTLAGFETAFDAFAFAFAHFSIDISLIHGCKTVGRWWTFGPPKREPKQIRMEL